MDSADATALAFDQRMRALLTTYGIPFVVIYGQGQARIDQAREAIAYQCKQHAAKQQYGNSQWQWNCEKCSDAQCEHRIFSALMETRSMRA